MDDTNRQLTEQVFGHIDVVSDVLGLLSNVQNLFNGFADIGDLIDDLINGIVTAIRGIPFIGGTIADVIDSLRGVSTKATSALNMAGDVVGAVTAGSTGAPAPTGNPLTGLHGAVNGVYQTATVAQAQASAAQLAIQQIVQNTNVGANGLNKLLNFNYNGNLSSTDWAADSAFVATNGEMALRGEVANGHYLAAPNYFFTSDNQSVTAQLGSEVNNDQYTYLCLRTNASRTQGVACRVSAAYIAIGTYNFTGPGGDPQFVTAQAIQRGQGNGTSIEFRAVGDAFVVLVDGNVVLASNGALGSKGSNWRGATVIMQRAQPFFVSFSFRLRSFGMYDFGTVGSAITSRTACRISRLSTSPVAVNISNGVQSAIPINFFSSVDFAQGMTVSDLTTGAIRVDTADWYEVTATFPAAYSGQAGYYGQAWWCLFVNDQPVTHAIPAGVTFRWPMNVGDIARCGIVNTMASVTLTSSAESSYGSSKPATLNSIGGTPGCFFQIVKD